MKSNKFNGERFLYCSLCSLIMIPAIILSIVVIFQTHESLNCKIVEKKYTLVECGSIPYRWSVYIIARDDSGKETNVTFSTLTINKEWNFLDEAKEGDELYISFAEPDEENLVGLRTKDKIYYDVKQDRKENILGIVFFAFMAFIALFLEVGFIIVSKKIFDKSKRIVKRTDRPVTEDMFKESFFD